MFPTRLPSVRWRSALLALLLLAALAAGCTAADDAANDEATEDSAAVEGEFGITSVAEAVATPTPTDAGADGGGAVPLPTDVVDTAATGERIIKEGTVTVVVDPGDFDVAFNQIISRAQALGGHVSGSSSASDDEGLISGQVTIRVPVRAFEDLLTVLGDAGEVTERSITSQDVTAEFTDLESRLRHLQAEERFYLGLLEEATSINDAVVVQQQLDGIQGEIEQIRGRMNLLEDRSAYSTLTVRITEQGADAAVSDDDSPTLAGAWDTARDVFIGTIGALLVVLTFAAPVAALLLLTYGAWRITRRNRGGRPGPQPVQQDTSVKVEEIL